MENFIYFTRLMSFPKGKCSCFTTTTKNKNIKAVFTAICNHKLINLINSITEYIATHRIV